ncbi:hypothetical protein PG990_002072 [Apiospora arundinis]|uniref:Uncharacterized protein n=1 Tax=Apiospora arundinis TaxID=335852 RepID=A0ABR2I3U4_9PEZI
MLSLSPDEDERRHRKPVPPIGLADQTQDSIEVPRIVIDLSISPPDYAFSRPEAPTMTLKVVMEHSRQDIITLYTEIAHLTLDTTVNIRNVNRGPNPRRRVQGCIEEAYFVTLQTGIPIEIPIYFGRPSRRPQPWSEIRRSVAVTGVDGLEPGHEYEVGFSEDDLRSIMWAPVHKQDILLENSDHGLEDNLESYPWIKDKPLDFVIHPANLKVLVEDAI